VPLPDAVLQRARDSVRRLLEDPQTRTTRPQGDVE